MTHDSIDIDGHAGAEALLGERLLDAWVPSAIASVGEACNVLRAEPVEGQSKVLVYVVRPPEGVTFADVQSDLEGRRRIRHPGVLQLLMSGRLPDGRLVLVTPATGATSFASILAMRPPQLPDAVRIGAQLARALQAMHDSVGAYGPLTPEHVLVDEGPDGHPEAKILPMWWAWRHGLDETPSTAWAPWRRVGDGHLMADDAFSIGALMWHAIAGKAPIEADALDTLSGGLPEPLPLLSTQVRRKLPAALDGIVANLMDPDRSERPTDLADIAARLEDIAHQLEGGGPSIGPPMVTATPVPIGSQLRERSLVLPIPPPSPKTAVRPLETTPVPRAHVPAWKPPTPADDEEYEDAPTAPDGARAIGAAVEKVETIGDGGSRSLPGLPMPVPRAAVDLAEAETFIEGDDDDAEEGGTPGTAATEREAASLMSTPEAPQAAPAMPPLSRKTPNSLPDGEAPALAAEEEEESLGGRVPWLALVAGTGLVGAAVMLALYLFGVFG